MTKVRIKHYRRIARQAGMTLIELTVVLLILIGLAGLMIPYVGSFTQKTHDSTNSSNLSSLNEAFGRYIAQKNKLPNNLETLTNSQDSVATNTGGCANNTDAAGSVYCGLLDPNVFVAKTYTAAATQTSDQIALTSLASAGMTSVHDNDPAAGNKTFGSGVDGASSPAIAYAQAGTLNLITVGCARDNTGAAVTGAGCTDTLKAQHLALALGGHESDYVQACYDYVAMGVGEHSTLINQTIASAPVHFPEDAAKGPVDYYNHYVAIIQVDKSNSAPCSSQTEKAKFVGVAMNVPAYPTSHLFGSNQSLAYGYSNNSNQ